MGSVVHYCACGMILHIRGRDSPHGVFDPRVRWDLGLDKIRSFRVVVVVVVVVVVSAEFSSYLFDTPIWLA